MSKSEDADHDARIAAIINSAPRHLVTAKVERSPELPDDNKSDRIAAILSSVPRHLITGTAGVESSPEVSDESPGNLSIPESPFNKKKTTRWSHIWFPENGYQVEVEGKPRWVCKRCR
jgi:hypothetical protein